MQNAATVICRGSDLSRDFAAALEGGEADAFYAVHLTPLSPEETALFLEARSGVQRGLSDLGAGRVVTEQGALAIIFDDKR